MAPLTEPIRVLLADDESLMRTGLRLILDGAPGIDNRVQLAIRVIDSRKTSSPR